MPHYQFFVCNHKQIPYDYRQKIDNVAQLQIIDDKKKNYRKKSVISACNVDYRLKQSGPKFGQIGLNKKKNYYLPKSSKAPFLKKHRL